MGSVDRGDDLTFKVNFTGEGAEKLRENVTEKLKEFMGDYTDDTLVEYVIVLLRNGRHKDEARTELDVFLGDDSDSFVSWLWDHLSTSLHLYVQPEETEQDVTEPNLPSDDRAGRDGSENMESGIESGRSSNLLRSRHNREWKGLIRDTADPPPLLSSEIEKVHPEEKPHHRASRVKRSVSPRHRSRRKRSRSDDRHPVKRDASRQVIDAPRRLLQFAVRDAVAKSRPEPTQESALKRLRSVVSASSEDLSLIDRPQRIRSVALVPNSMATVIKAVAEAAEDVRKVKPKSVFDRLGRGEDPAEPQFTEPREAIIEDEEYGGVNQFLNETQPTYPERHRQFGGNLAMMESDSVPATDYVSDYERYEDTELRAYNNVYHSDAFGGDDEGLILTFDDVVDDGDDGLRFGLNKQQDEPPITRNTPRKVVNLPGSVSTRKPRPHYQASKEVPAPQDPKPLLQNVAAVDKYDVRPVEENNVPVPVSNGNVKSVTDSQRTQQSTNGLSTHSLDDADQRTIFVNNVHVAASKDSLSQHFNKFGEVLKVIINTDAASGQPTGSAVIEFARKESADNALSLDGTSFMSRILKVMKRSPSALQKPAPATITTWPRAIRGSPYARFPRVPFPRSPFRARPPIRGGARSLQWKREAQPASSEAGTSATTSSSSSLNAVPSFPARKFTYVRPEAKPNANVGASAT